MPHGFPMPWQIQTMYRIMISYYKFSFEGSWELQKPRKPDFVIVPPASDIENLFQPPDFSGVDSSNPIVDVCEAIVALVEWAFKELGAAAKLAGDLVKMAASPGTYLLRLGLYELAMMVWDVITKTHEVLAHTGFMAPHGLVTYDDGELRLPDEIDLPLITLGWTVDAAFQQALAAAIDPLGNLDKDPSVFATGHSVTDPRYPYYPVLRYTQDGTRAVVRAVGVPPPVGVPDHEPDAHAGRGPALADADRALRRRACRRSRTRTRRRPATPGSDPARTRRAPGRTRCSSVPAHPSTRRCDASTRSRRPRAPPTRSTRPTC